MHSTDTTTIPQLAPGFSDLDALVLTGAFDGLRAIQSYCFDASDAKGFHDRGRKLFDRRRGLDELIEAGDLPRGGIDDRESDAELADYIGNRLMLIAGEATEAHEELRAGHRVDEAYHSEGGKPEGVPSELADIVIRVFDLAGEAGIDLASVIAGKLAFNATRERMHGGKRF